MRVAAVQLTATDDKDANLRRAAAGIAEAAAAGARLVVLPEMFSCCGGRSVLHGGAEPLGGPTSAWAADQAATHGLWLVAGSIIERATDGRFHNTSAVYGPDGGRAAVYRKVHLFDVDVPGAAHRESDVVAPGDGPVVAWVPRADLDPAGGPSAEHAASGAPSAELGPSAEGEVVGLGLSVCYDLRFPELYRILTLDGARIVVVPAAFTATTGPPHWEVLLRARAIEDQVVVIAADQCGASSPALRWHGHSMVVDPWGRVVAEAGTDPAVVVADVDLADQDRIRAVLPSVANRRPAAYRWPDPPAPGAA